MRLRRWTARVLKSVAQTRRVFEAPPRRAGGPLPSARPPPRPAPCALLEEALKGCAVFLSEALGPSLPRSVLRERAPHSTVCSHTCRPRWPGPRLSERAVTHRGLARPPLSASTRAPAACPAPRRGVLPASPPALHAAPRQCSPAASDWAVTSR